MAFKIRPKKLVTQMGTNRTAQDELRHIKLPAGELKNLPAEQPLRSRLVQQKQRQRRNVRIYKEWLKSPESEREVVIADMADRYALAPGRVRSVIERLHSDGEYIPVDLRAEVDAIREVKREQLLRHAEESVAELLVQREYLEALRDGGELYVEVEITERTGDRAGETRKKVPIDRAIASLNDQIIDFEAKTGRALETYMAKPATEATHRKIHELRLTVDERFRETFDRLEGAIDADYEVDNGTDSNSGVN